MREVVLLSSEVSIPNVLSLLRVALIPFILALLGGGYNLASAILFAIAALTDMIDGIVARRFNSVTSLGKLLDPLADKLLVCLTLIMLVGLQKAPAWVVLIIVAREFIVTGLRSESKNKGRIIAASSHGKLKAVVQYLAVFFLCLWDGAHEGIVKTAGEVLLVLALILTIYSGAKIFLKTLRENEYGSHSA